MPDKRASDPFALLRVGFASFAVVAADLISFIARPTLTIEKGSSRHGAAICAFWLFVCSMLATALFAIAALPFLLNLDSAPDQVIASPPSSSLFPLAIALVVAGPVVEELMFRGWLSGRVRAIAVSFGALGLFYVASYVLTTFWLAMSAYAGLVSLVIAAIPMLVFAPLDRGRSLPAFERIFPLLFWGQGATFGLLHIENYAGFAMPLALLAVLPLVVCGFVWGYARIKLGLGWAILLHALYNVPSAGLILILSR